MSDQDPQFADPQVAYLAQLQAEAATLPEAERAEHEALVAELAGELALSQAMQAEAHKYIDRAKELSRQGKAAEKTGSQAISVDLSKIGWATEEDTVEIPAETVETPGLEYEFLDLTQYGREPRSAMEKLQKQSDDDGIPLGTKLTEYVKQHGIPNLHDSLKKGKNVRSVSIGGRSVKDVKKEQSLNTSYPAYKIDVRGPQNRAIVLGLGQSEAGKPVYGLAVLYDHDDDGGVYRNMYLK